MSLFGRTKLTSYLGVDIGAGGIKVVELANEKGRARLLTYGWSERKPDLMEKSLLEDPGGTADLLKSIVAKAKCVSKRAVTGITVSQVFSSIISVDVSPQKKKEFDAAVKQQARKITPRPLEEMVLDYKVIEETPKTTKVLLTAAEETLVKKYVEIFRRAGIELVSLETETLALIRSLVGRDVSPIVLLDIGALRTNISVVEKGIPYLSRSIDVGGFAFTKTISERLKVSLDKAEQMKQDLALAAAGAPEGLPAMVEPFLATMTNELRYVMNLYANQRGGTGAVEKVVLTGGAALFPRLPEMIGNAVGVRAYLGDPWARVVYPTDVRPLLDQIGSRFSVAVGLGMRDIE